VHADAPYRYELQVIVHACPLELQNVVSIGEGEPPPLV
jgi:hypothetical protein